MQALARELPLLGYSAAPTIPRFTQLYGFLLTSGASLFSRPHIHLELSFFSIITPYQTSRYPTWTNPAKFCSSTAVLFLVLPVTQTLGRLPQRQPSSLPQRQPCSLQFRSNVIIISLTPNTVHPRDSSSQRDNQVQPMWSLAAAVAQRRKTTKQTTLSQVNLDTAV